MLEKESIMGGQWRKENPNPRVHRSGGKLGEPRFPLERVDPRVGIFLYPLTTHDGFYLSLYAAIRPRGHSRQVSATSVSIRQKKER